jgi:hypothetical protein
MKWAMYRGTEQKGVKNMKLRRLIAVIGMAMIVTALTSFAADGPRPEVMWRLSGLLPGDLDDWSAASRLEVQARFWSAGGIGTALSVGVGSWQAVSEFVEEDNEYGYMATSVYGSMTTIPIGISALYRCELSRGVSVVFEAGVRYVLAQSNIQSEISYDDGVESGYLSGTIVTEDSFQGVAGISVQSVVSPGINVECGFGYQFDILEPHEIFMGDDIGATSMRAVSVNIGCSWEF